MHRSSVILALLLSACLGLGGVKDKTQHYGAKFTGSHAALARCVVNSLQSDSRWVIKGLQYDVRRYPDIEATEIYAYPQGSLPGTYARNSPENPDAVPSYLAPPVPKVQAYRGAAAYTGPDYSFNLMIKRTDSETVRATLKGNEYVSGVAWAKLEKCSAP